MPMYLRPYRLFSRITSNSWQSFSSGSLSRWKGRDSLSRNFVVRLEAVARYAEHHGAGAAELVMQIAANSCDSTVQPEVTSFG